MPEAALERAAKRQIEKRGGELYKFTSPGRRGAPDRICEMPGNRRIYAEFKYGKNGLSPAQRNFQKRLRELGAEVWNICSKQNLIEFLAYLDGE